MRIGIVSPSKLKYIEQITNDARMIVMGLAAKLAKENHEIVVTPDKGSVSEFFAQEYIKRGGKKVYSVIPLDDKEWGYSYVNLNLGEKINCNTWRNQPEKMNEETDALLVLGYSVGGMPEMSYTKWIKPKPIFIITELISAKLPEELNRSLDLRYVSYKRLKL